MKLFIKRLIVFLFAFLFVFEITLRLFGLAGKTMPVVNYKNDRLLKPGSEGFWTKGGCKEINARYSINQQGWNSLRDYEKDLKISSENKIAIVGDSYVQGLHTDVSNSIGRQLEANLGNKYIVQEYGRAGGNIHDYKLVYSKFNLEEYKHVFVIVQEDDFFAKNPNFMKVTKKDKKKGVFYKIYQNIAVIKYLNINHGISNSFSNLFKFNKGKKKKVGPKFSFNSNEKEKYENVSIMYEKSGFSYEDVTNLKLLEIIHEEEPYNFGFDKHWNSQGRANVAKTMSNYILNNSN